ncbi:MAG TPA: OmpA family protein, partial [Saprospiraceae bacterium]|nr:OmpA family protein [Saprospiraceae bacterium]
MKGLKFSFFFLFFSLSISMWAQNVKLEGYAFEENNRGYLNLVKVTILDNDSKAVVGEVYSNIEGYFSTQVPIGKDYLLRAEKAVFKKTEVIVSTKGLQAGQKAFAKIQMARKPGYIFDVTMAEEKDGDGPTDAILGARVEIYNNTKKKEVLVLENHPIPTFSAHFENGNHYTVMIRKSGYFTKRMEAYVNVKGCILCFEGIGEVRPEVSDNLTAGHTMGTLIANVELKKIELNKGFILDNIYYDYNKWDIRPDAAKELDKLITVLKDNPNLIVELGSHTDSRGREEYNMTLSQKRAQAAVDYIKSVGFIDESRIIPKGYGETQLINNCKNGVKCSESKHQKNRRTELKIIGFLENNSLQNKSLKQIIEEEEMDRMIANLSKEGEIKVLPGSDMPEELKRQNEANRQNSNTKTTDAITKPAELPHPTLTSP